MSDVLIQKRRHVFQPHCRMSGRPDLVQPGMDLLAEWIYQARVAMGFSQAGLGRVAGLSQSTISRLERGCLPGMSLHRLVVLLVILEPGIILVVRRSHGTER